MSYFVLEVQFTNHSKINLKEFKNYVTLDNLKEEYELGDVFKEKIYEEDYFANYR
jgi:hypothetical protein